MFGFEHIVAYLLASRERNSDGRYEIGGYQFVPLSVFGCHFRTVTSQVQDLDGSTAGLDGVVYYFTSTDAKGTNQMGRKWSPKKVL